MRRRILTSTLLVIFATVLTLGVPLTIVSWQRVADVARQNLTAQLETVSNLFAAQAADGVELPIDRLAPFVPEGGYLVVEMPGQPDQTVGERPAGRTITERLVMAGSGKLRLSVSADSVRAEQIQTLALVGLAVLLSILVGTVIAIVTARRLASPLTDVARRAARLGAGDFRPFAPRHQIAELDRVLEVLDASAADIAALIQRERDLAGDISHQLRTRITGLRLRLEELSLHPDPDIAAEVDAALDQTDRLVTVIDDLLASARSRRAAGATHVSLADELRAIEVEQAPAFAAAGRTLQVRCPPGVWVRATAVRLREAIVVLVDNALRHGAGTVRVSVRPGPPMTVVEVADEGEGVAEALVGHIFDRGVSTAHSTGIGLGLARAFIESDGGRLELRSPRPAVFAMFLIPADAPPPEAVPAARAADAGAGAAGPGRETVADYPFSGEDAGRW